MAATVMSSTSVLPAPWPPGDAAGLRERADFENALRLWTLGVRFATRDLLGLGRPYEVHLSVPRQADPVTEFSQLGFDLLPLYGSHVMCVRDVKPLDQARMDVRFVSLHGAPVSLVSPLQGMCVEDFLVGINGDDLLAAPSHGLGPLRKRILGACNAARLRGAGVVILRFVRLDAFIQIDASRQVSHGAVLNTLDRLEKAYAGLKVSYDELLGRNRTTVTQRLTRHKKLLAFCIHRTTTMKETVLRDERYQFTSKFLAWCTAMIESSAFEVGADTDDDVDDWKASDMFDTDDGADDEQRQDDTANIIFQADAPELQHPVQPRPTDIDLRWRDILSPQEMKWLPQAHEVLTKFIEGLVDGFTSDGFWISEIASRSRSIAERLVISYARKLVSSTTASNTTIRKDFMKQARMLRNNIMNPKNKQFRRDVLSGSISVATLCDMTSEQLAPESVQADRQRRYEQHAKEITITDPSGSVLVKTKHGLKELNVGEGSSLEEDTMMSSDVNDVPPTPAKDLGLKSFDSHTTSEVAGKVRTIEINTGQGVNTANGVASKDGTKNDPFNAAMENRTSQQGRPVSIPHRTEIISSDPITAKYTPAEAQAFLSAMFDPAKDVEGTIRQLQAAIHSTPLATMSNEFMLAPGVQLYRDILTAQTQRGTVQYRARVRLLHWLFQYDASSDREATMSALYQLLKALEECRRLFGRLLDQLHHECQFPQPEHNRDARRRAVDVLVREGMKVSHYPCQHQPSRDTPEIRADAHIDGISVVSVLESDIVDARSMAAHSVADFMNDLVAIRNRRHYDLHEDRAHVQARQYPGRDRYHVEQNYPEVEEHFEDRKDAGVDSNSRFVLGERKRPLEAFGGNVHDEEREKSRRKLATDTDRAFDLPREELTFFKDVKGEDRQPTRDPEEEERKQKLQVEMYQELVRFLFRSRGDAVGGIQLDWNPDILEKEVTLNTRLKIVRKIALSQNSGNFVCILVGLEGILNITNTSKSLEEASAHVTNTLSQWLDGIYGDWSILVDRYIAIMDRKHIQRVPQADASLSAANETRKDRATSNFVKDEEMPKGALSEYLIRVRSLVAVRQVCLNMKMAKRAAGEEFRDLLEWIKKAREESASNATRAASSTNSGSTTVSNTRQSAAMPIRAPPKPPTRVSNMVVCSDDSGGDDASEDDVGGGYSDDDDWHPQPKIEETSGGLVRDEKHSQDRAADLLRQPYPIASESGGGDDSRFRAVIRSLFTPEDELCAGISRIRGALKYQGHHDTRIVPNVQASIRLELLQGVIFNVYASVNNVVHYRATTRTKPEACDMAVNGLLRELDKIRQVWVELMHFYHMKELANHDPMDSFNALRLANITKIDTLVELPPPKNGLNRMVEAKMATNVHCAIYFGGHVVYRVDADTEQEAHALATYRALAFLIDLIDKGLDPTPTGVQDEQFAPMQNVDWTCTIRVDDFGDSYRRVEYFVDGRWAISGRVPGPSNGILWPKRLTLNQVDRIPMPRFEQKFGASNDPSVFFFRIEATFENGKFVNHIAEYGHKNKYRAFVLHFEVAEDRDIDVFVFPPAASVNSRNNLYWSHKIMPRELSDLKAVYGYATQRRRGNW